MNHWIKAERPDVLKRINGGTYIPPFPQDVFKILKYMLREDPRDRPEAATIVSSIGRIIEAAERAR